MTEQNYIEADIIAEKAGLPTPLEVELDSQKAIARISAIGRVIDGCAKVSIQRTNPKDWVRLSHKDKQGNIHESFYLQATGAQKIRPIWGIYYRDRQITKETYPDGTYAYIVTGKVGSKVLDQLYGEVIVEIDGGRNSADTFFTKGERIPDPMDVRKAALANWEARAITALIGLKNMTPEDLEKNGIELSKIAGVEFKPGSEGGGKTDIISQAQQKRLYAIANKAGMPNNTLHNYIFTKYGLSSSAEILRSDYETIVNWAQSGGTQREPGEEG